MKVLRSDFFSLGIAAAWEDAGVLKEKNHNASLSLFSRFPCPNPSVQTVWSKVQCLKAIGLDWTIGLRGLVQGFGPVGLDQLDQTLRCKVQKILVSLLFDETLLYQAFSGMIER